MIEVQEFELLKNQMLRDSNNYIKAAKEITFLGLDNINARVQLMELYSNFIISNIAYQQFIYKCKKLKRAAFSATEF
jgi:hypothetical protein